jgi:hypothetical protein
MRLETGDALRLDTRALRLTLINFEFRNSNFEILFRVPS